MNGEEEEVKVEVRFGKQTDPRDDASSSPKMIS